MLLGTFTKQPSEQFGYDVSYTKFLDATDHIILIKGVTVSNIQGTSIGAGDLAVEGSYLLDNGTRVKVFLRDGKDGETYKITVLVQTNNGIVKEDEFKVKVKEY